MKLVSLLFILLSLIPANQALGYIYAATITKKAPNDKTIIFLTDAHAYFPLSMPKNHPWHQQLKDDLAFAKKQQADVVAMIKELEKNGPVLVLVEDASCILEKDTPITPGIIKTQQTGCQTCSPLLFFHHLCRTHNIPCINVECRNPLQSKKKKTKRNNHANQKQLTQLRRLYGNVSSSWGMEDALLLDAHIIEEITKSNSRYIIVFAGAYHTGAVHKILYQQGYIDTNLYADTNLDPFWKKQLYDFKTMNPLMGMDTVERERPSCYTSLKQDIIAKLVPTTQKHLHTTGSPITL